VAGFDVDTQALRQFAQLVDRQKGYLDQVRSERAAQIPDGDFGIIMDLISGPYTSLLPKVDAGWSAAVTSMGKDVGALQATAADYDDGDGRTRDRFETTGGN
jgi:hypothetical protein